MKQRKQLKMKVRRHYTLFDRDLPFKAKVERDRTKYYRKRKHSKGDSND